MTSEKRVLWRAYFDGGRLHAARRALVAPVAFVRDLGGDPPAEVAYCTLGGAGVAIVGFDVEHRPVWARGVRSAA